MKLFGGLLALSIFSYAYCSIEQIARECLDQEGASQEDVEALQKMQAPQGRTQKCFYACIFEKIGTSDGKRFDKERFVQIGDQLAKDDENKKNKVREMADRCDGVENEDRCELAADIAECMKG